MAAEADLENGPSTIPEMALKNNKVCFLRKDTQGFGTVHLVNFKNKTKHPVEDLHHDRVKYF